MVSTDSLRQNEQRVTWPRRLFRAALLLASAAMVFRIYWEYRRWNRPEDRIARALNAVDAKDYDQMRTQLHEWEGETNPSACQHLLKGALLLHDGELASALAALERAIPAQETRVRA